MNPGGLWALLVLLALASEPAAVTATLTGGVEPVPTATRALLSEEVVSVTASSSLPSATGRFAASKLIDGDRKTAWVQGSEQRVGEASVEITLREGLPVTRLTLWPGYLESELSLREHARPARVRLITDAGDDLRVEIPDPPPGWPAGEGHHPATVTLSGKPVKSLRIVVEAAHPGRKFADSAISELELEVGQ